ncbi:hypothetical protein BH11BAC3_BH11BAC3_00890 [soil metagenome]
MNEQSPYDDAILNKLQELPVANEDVAWAAMERMLDKDDDDKPVPPPFFRNSGCMGALLLLILLAGGFFLVDFANWFHSNKQKMVTKEKDSTKINTKSSNQTGNIDTTKTGTTNTVSTHIQLIPGDIKNADNDFTDTLSLAHNKNSFSLNDKVLVKHETAKTENQNQSVQTNNNNRKANKNHSKHQPFISKIPVKIRSKITNDVAEESGKKDSSTQPVFTENQLKENGDNTTILAKKSPAFADTSRKNKADTLISKTDSANAPVTKRRFYVGAGLGMFQLIPVAGQKSNPYNASGRKNTLGDYIPSVYLRLYKEKKWFIQGEFRYGAPQYTRDILFSQKGIFDSSGAILTLTNNRVQKTYYHQLPISFHYFLAPGFSLGAGFTFNKFTSAIVQQEVHRTSPVTQADTLISFGTFTQKKADSNFVKTFLQAQVEMQYSWKRFSAGARYSFGLQPYLKFQFPGGGQSRESNRSLQLFLRYELWQSKK